MSPADVRPGSVCEARFLAQDEPERTHIHRQRHFPEDQIRKAYDEVGLRSLGVFGEKDGILVRGVDERVNTKAVYIAGINNARHSA
jgi:hypothetical protein